MKLISKKLKFRRKKMTKKRLIELKREVNNGLHKFIEERIKHIKGNPRPILEKNPLLSRILIDLYISEGYGRRCARRELKFTSES